MKAANNNTEIYEEVVYSVKSVHNEGAINAATSKSPQQYFILASIAGFGYYPGRLWHQFALIVSLVLRHCNC